MAIDTGTKIAMFFAGIAGVDLVLSSLAKFSIISFLTGLIPTAYTQFNWIVPVIFGIAGAYTLYKVFSK